MRRFGLILENLDGLDDPAGKFVMRGVPPTLGLQMTLEKDTSLGEGPVQMTGWSGDGSPGTGSLREFAIGAVTQHFTRRLARVAGRDFTLPTEHQLDAMEAFQLSLGRSADFDLSKITFLDGNVQTGRALFLNGTGSSSAGGNLRFCHVHGGAFSITVRTATSTPMSRVCASGTRDPGLFQRRGIRTGANKSGTYGNGTFNSHLWSRRLTRAVFTTTSATLEEVVQFYSGPAFMARLCRRRPDSIH